MSQGTREPPLTPAPLGLCEGRFPFLSQPGKEGPEVLGKTRSLQAPGRSPSCGNATGGFEELRERKGRELHGGAEESDGGTRQDRSHYKSNGSHWEGRGTPGSDARLEEPSGLWGRTGVERGAVGCPCRGPAEPGCSRGQGQQLQMETVRRGRRQLDVSRRE